MTQPTCPLCSHPVLCYVRPGELYWYCRQCYQGTPLIEEINQAASLQNSSRSLVEHKQTDTALWQQVRQELERLDRVKDDFLNTIAYELRTLLTTMQMATQMLEIATHQNSVSVSEVTLSRIKLNQADYFEILNDACDQAAGLITHLLSGFSETDLRVFLMNPSEVTA